MAISTNYRDVEKQYHQEEKERYFSSIDEYEGFYLQSISERGEYNYYTDKSGKEKCIDPVDHFPELKEYEVWSEVYRATGKSGSAHLHGKTLARNFKQACHIVMAYNYLKFIEENENKPGVGKGYGIGRWDYDPSRLTYSRCA